MTNQTRSVPGQTREPFQAQSIDHVPALLEKGYALRYQVYCLERQFLPAENYLRGLEIDEFDRYAIHVGAVDVRGELAGTARAVTVSELGLPLFRHCTMFPGEMDRQPGHRSVVEVGRLAVSRSYRRRADDHASLSQTASPSGGAARTGHAEERRGGADVLVTVLKALYQATKRIGATHWLAAMEPSLIRLLARQGFPFQVLGPECEYLGRVAPYQLDLNEFDQVMMSGGFPTLGGVRVWPRSSVRAAARRRVTDHRASSGRDKTRTANPRRRSVTGNLPTLRPRRVPPGRCASAVVAALLLCTSIGDAQDVTEPSLKAAFIYNFAKFTEWPQETLPPTGTFTACVLGATASASASPIQAALARTVKGRQLAGRQISVVQAQIDGHLRSCHLLYLSGVTAAQVAAILEAVQGTPVLTVSDVDEFARRGGIAQMFVEDGKMRFQLNLEAAKRARLELSSKLLVLAAQVFGDR